MPFPFRRFVSNASASLLTLAGTSPPIPDQPPQGQPILAELDLEKLAALAKQWVTACRTTHKLCTSTVSDASQPFPTRLLDVDAGDPSVIILRRWSLGAQGRYVALSHCWGLSQPSKTTKSTLSSHCQGMTVTALPKTFSDAVRVVRSLGMRYLWIDSLCIVQDDQDDWRREAAMMSDIYANAYLTMYAAHSTSCDSGFLEGRAPDPIVKMPQQRLDPSFYISVRHIFSDDIDKSNLASRAWVIQKKILSPRTLHFTATQVYWECWTRHQGEDLDDSYLGSFKQDAYPKMLAPGGQSPDELANHTPSQWWYLLSSYTACHLTYQKDKLIAISGLMNRISQVTSKKHVAGIFEDRLHEGLLWSNSGRPFERVTEIRFPSWSWASRKGRIDYVQLYQWAVNDDVQLMEPHTDTTAILKAKMCRLKSAVDIGSIADSTEYNDFPPELDYPPTSFRSVAPGWLDDEGHLGWLTIDEDKDEVVDMLHIGWVIVACNLNKANEDHITESPLYCVLVRSVVNNTYERIGIGAVQDLSWFEEVKEDKMII